MQKECKCSYRNAKNDIWNGVLLISLSLKEWSSIPVARCAAEIWIYTYKCKVHTYIFFQKDESPFLPASAWHQCGWEEDAGPQVRQHPLAPLCISSHPNSSNDMAVQAQVRLLWVRHKATYTQLTDQNFQWVYQLGINHFQCLPNQVDGFLKHPASQIRPEIRYLFGGSVFGSLSNNEYQIMPITT